MLNQLATGFPETTHVMEKPIDEAGLKLNRYEKEEMDEYSAAHDKSHDIRLLETLSSGF